MFYSKPPLSYGQQLALLTTRGLDCHDAARTIEWLQRSGHYRLSAYLIPFRIPDTDNFRRGTTLDQVVDLYKFDCGLRLLLLQALDRIEIGVRAVMTYHLAHALGAFGHTAAGNFKPGYDHAWLIRTLAAEEQGSTELFVRHFRATYTAPLLTILRSGGRASRTSRATGLVVDATERTQARNPTVFIINNLRLGEVF